MGLAVVFSVRSSTGTLELNRNGVNISVVWLLQLVHWPVVFEYVVSIVKILVMEEHVGGENLEILTKCINDDDDVDTDHDHGDDHIEKLTHEEVEGVLVELVVDVLNI